MIMVGHYIVFAIDSKYKDHDGKVFSGYADAKKFAAEIISENYADKAVIGMFIFDGTKEMHIGMIETIGFTGDKKNVNQLNLFLST